MWLYSIREAKFGSLAPEDLGVMAHAYNVSIKVAEADGSDV